MAQQPHIAATSRVESPPPTPVGAPPTTVKPLQFSMRFLLLAMTVAAVALAVLSWVGLPLVAILLAIAMYFVVPVCLGTLAVYCRGYRQTFFAGTLAGSMAPMFIGSPFMYRGDVRAWLAWGLAQLFAGSACGVTALLTRRFLERRGWHIAAADRERIPRE
jgi:hypothetical protein